MKADREALDILEDLLFDYERQTALVEVLQTLVNEKAVEVAGVPENTLEYALYEIDNRLTDINKKLGKVIEDSTMIRGES